VCVYGPHVAVRCMFACVHVHVAEEQWQWQSITHLIHLSHSTSRRPA
jgi:hypothetical protein